MQAGQIVICVSVPNPAFAEERLLDWARHERVNLFQDRLMENFPAYGRRMCYQRESRIPTRVRTWYE